MSKVSVEFSGVCVDVDVGVFVVHVRAFVCISMYVRVWVWACL